MASGTFLPPGLSRSIVKIESGGTNNYVMTAVDGETIQGEASLQFDGSALTVGANTDGYDVKFFGNASGKYMLWDESEDDLIVIGDVGIGAGTGSGTLTVTNTGSSIPTALLLRNLTAVGSADTGVNIVWHGNDTPESMASQAVAWEGTDNNDVYMSFSTRGSDNITERLRIKHNGFLELNSTGAEIDHGIIFDGNAVDYHIGLEDTGSTHDYLRIGVGSTLGTTPSISIDPNRHIGFGANPSNQQMFEFIGTFTAGVGNADIFRVYGTLTAAAADEFSGVYIAPTFVKHSSGTHANFSSLQVHPPIISGAGGTTVTNSSHIMLVTDASGASNNYQIFDLTNSAYLSTSGVWTDASHGDVKIHSPADLDIMPELLAQLNLKQYHRRTPLYDSDGKTMKNEDGSTIWTDVVRSDDSYLRYGPLAEEVPEFLATADRKGIGAGYTAGFLIGVAQNHDARIEALEQALGV